MTNTPDEQRYCLYCGKPVKGRIDKKFCDDWCRNAFNNKRYSQSSGFVRNINAILRRNRQILEELIPSGKETARASRKKLAEKGFNFQYITHTHITQKGLTYFFCYEYGYLSLEHDYCLLVNRGGTNNSS
ncbi:MAG: DUF2116 family Zn-ribbon domain-containing protein [Chitinophagaceae bacterium]|nr:DUF2116 family Zn-ribbon domain-containing protein [Chitinophagaceae bacterium]